MDAEETQQLRDEAPQGSSARRLLSIVCPVFRESETIDLFHATLIGALVPLRDRYAVEILYVIDPSKDDTEARVAAIAEASNDVTGIIMSRRFGHQAALLAGIEESAGDAIVMLDSDLQHPPQLIPELVRRWEDGADIVQTLRGEDPSLPWLKRATSRGFYRLLMQIGSIDLPEGAADYRLISARVADALRKDLPERNPFLRGLLSWVGFRVFYLAYEPASRRAGTSKYGTGTLLAFALNGIFSFSKVPLRLCIGVGITLAVLSVVFTLVQVVMYTAGNTSVPGWASLFGAVGIIGGIQLLFLGVIGEYVGIVFDEVKRRPRYLVDRRVGATTANRPAARYASETTMENANDRTVAH